MLIWVLITSGQWKPAAVLYRHAGRYNKSVGTIIMLSYVISMLEVSKVNEMCPSPNLLWPDQAHLMLKSHEFRMLNVSIFCSVQHQFYLVSFFIIKTAWHSLPVYIDFLEACSTRLLPVLGLHVYISCFYPTISLFDIDQYWWSTLNIVLQSNWY